MTGQLVSALIAVHNGEQTLERAIRSVLTQTYENVEAVVVDDASTDGSWQIIQDLQKTDGRIVAIRREEASGGPAIPRNEAIQASSGDYLALLDQDDAWFPEKTERQLEHFVDSSVGLVFSDCLTSDDKSYFELHGLPPGPTTLCSIIRHNPIAACTAMWPREVFERVGPFDTSLSSIDDRDYWVRIALNGYSLANVPTPLARLNTLGNRLSSDNVLHDRLSVSMWKQFAEQYPENSGFGDAFIRARQKHAMSVAHSNRSLSAWRRPGRIVTGWSIDPTLRTLVSIIGQTKMAQRVERISHGLKSR